MMLNITGQYVVTDAGVCHGQPTFRGTRIMVHQVLDMVAREVAWDDIIAECHGGISREAIAEAIALASRALVDHADEYVKEPSAA